METELLLDLNSLLSKTGIPEQYLKFLNIGIGLIVIFLLAWLTEVITRKVVLRALKSVAKRTSTNWDDILLEKKVFNRLAHIVPALIIYSSIGVVLREYENAVLIIRAILKIYMIVMVLLAIDSFINSLHQIYKTLKVSKDRDIKGYIQVVKIIVYFLAIILILSIILNRKPGALFAGLGAMAAVLLLIFKDTILGFVASIQLSANNMVKIGDWISMPSHGADGDVIEVTLNTVKVQNWDKTISTIPTYALVSESFSNWRGMEESGGRRIKRHINIDMKSVTFCTPEMIEKFKKIQYLKGHIEKRQAEIEEYNRKNNIDDSISVNGRRMTNFGTFRYYLEEYLKNHPKTHNNMTMLVRHLQPTEKGIPIEVYVFSNDQAWANYEAIQSDIFDHILAVIPEFELRVFQNPTGDDFKYLTK
ncbi:MAG TPA: mechanosensitive ion channel protein MscS [Bacteroidales bacterium]|jgi:miniconductance mechanosensitive channel|nr:mechanosensitive ion channel protein MscS [Bacteroidales bacterium]